MWQKYVTVTMDNGMMGGSSCLLPDNRDKMRET